MCVIGRAGWRPGASGLGCERPVHPFMAAVWLGFTGLDALRQEAQAHPPS
jgi:hypothetical protein